MADARCATCDEPVTKGEQCAACAGRAATLAASSAPTKAGLKQAKGADPLIGAEVIGQYVIRSLLGKGGMGAVYLADQPSVSRRAVIKVLHPVHSRDADSKARFDIEARAASQLNHPHIVTIYNYGAMADGTLFLAMEHLDGQTLEQITAKRRLPLARTVDIVAQIADALGDAHRNGVVHRDVKPSNVMLVARGQTEDFVKVVDFGIAHVDGTRLTETGVMCGTPIYMSPEQIRNKAIDGRSDLYSLGCILYELITGEVPFDSSTPLALAYMHVHETPKRASELAPKAGVTPAMDAFLARVLAKEPADRPKNAEAFRDELRAAVATDAAVPVAVVRAESKPAPKPETPTPKPSKAMRETGVTPAKPKAAKVETPTPKPKAAKAMRETSVARGFAKLATAVRGSGSLFRRRKSLGQRLMARVRAFGGRARRQKRWTWIVIGSLVALSLGGVGWYVMTHMEVMAPAKATPATPTPAKPTPKPTRPKRPTSGTGSRTH